MGQGQGFVSFSDLDTPPVKSGAVSFAELEQMPAMSPVASHGDEFTWRKAMPFVSGVADAAQGAYAGAYGSLMKAGDLARRATGAERIIDRPDVQAAMTAPDSWPGVIGKTVEQGAEFALPLSKVAKIASWPGRIAASAAVGGGGAAFQSQGDPVATTLGIMGGIALPPVHALTKATGAAVTRAAAGAKEGGLGGALAAGIRNVAPSEPRVMLIQALKPHNSLTNFPRSIEKALPEIKAAERAIGGPIETVDELLTATKAAKTDIQAQLGQMRGAQRAIGAEVDLSPVADAMVASIPKKLQLEDPGAALRLAKGADAYRRQFTLDEAETLLRETNAELDWFYAMFPGKQRAALKSNPAAAQLEAQARTLRTAIYQKLDDPGAGEAARELQRRYGALMEVEDVAFRRSNVAARQQPESLSEQIGAVRAAGEIARGTWKTLHGNPMGLADIAAGMAGRSAAKAIKDSQTTDALIKRAFASYSGERVPVTMPSPRQIRGLLPPASRRTGPAPDTSFVRGVPAQPAISWSPRQLPPGRTPIPLSGEVATPTPDPSFVRGVPAQYGERWTPPAPEPPPVAAAQPATPPPPAAAPVQPAKTRVTRAASRQKAQAPTVQTPAVAAQDVRSEVQRVIDTKGAKSAAEVQQRVMAALTNELESAKQAAGFGQLEGVARRNGEHVIRADDRAVATVDKYGRIKPLDFPGITGGTDTKGRTTWTHDATGKAIDLSDLFGFDPDSRSLTPAANRDQALRRVSAALSRVKGAGQLTVQIPGDGTFTIERNPHAIQTLLDRIKSGGSSPWGGIAEGAKPSKPPTADQVNLRAWKPTW